MKRTSLYNKHVALGAKIVPFAGYEMPLQYKGLLTEHHAVRNSMGMFDVSHMGEFFVSGPKALELIQHVTSNDAAKLSPGKIQYSCFPNAEGGIVDDLLVYCLSENHYMLVVNAANLDKDMAWLQTANEAFGVSISDQSDEFSLLAVQGPKATACLQTLTNADLSSVSYYNFIQGTLAGIENLIISNTGYTGAGGFELYVKNSDAEKLWDAVMEAGKTFGIEPAGLGARDTLRMEMGFCLYGNDIDDTTSPIEAGLGWITKFTKKFINSENLERQKSEGPAVKLTGFMMQERGIPRQGYSITDKDGNTIGRVTSGTQSPTLNQAIGMGYVPSELAANGGEIFIQIRGNGIRATTCKFPFIQTKT
jgi:aminomethyltransferase